MPKHPPNHFQIKQANLAIDLARQAMQNPQLAASDLAKENSISCTTITHARIILEHGTAQQLMDVTTGKRGIKSTQEEIRKTLTPEQVKAIRKRPNPVTDQYRKKLLDDANIWANLGDALRGLAGLPDPSDLLKITFGNTMRERSVERHLESAVKWLEDFNHAWNEHRNGRATKGHVDPGVGGSTSGTQHPKSAA